MQSEPVMLGIDGGATYSFAVAVNSVGRVLARSESGSLYFFGSSLSESRRNLTDLIKSVEIQLPIQNQVQQIVMGNAALFLESSEREKEMLCRGIVPLDRTRVVGDSIATYHGASLGKPGILITCGTGSIILIQNQEGRYFQTGGWGHLLGDEGGGYWIAIQSIRSAIAAVEGRGPQTALVNEICRWFDVKDLADIVPNLYNPKFSKDKLAVLAQHLSSVLGEEDPGFNEVCVRGGEELARQTLAAVGVIGLELDPIPLFLHGGVVRKNGMIREAIVRTLKEQLPVTVSEPALSPILGAALLAMSRAGISVTSEIVETLRTSYDLLNQRVPVVRSEGGR